MVKFIAYICFWFVFAAGAVTTLTGVGVLAYKAYRKIKDLITRK